MVAKVRFCLIGCIEISITLLKRKSRQKKQHGGELHRENTRYDFYSTAVGVPLYAIVRDGKYENIKVFVLYNILWQYVRFVVAETAIPLCQTCYFLVICLLNSSRHW